MKAARSGVHFSSFQFISFQFSSVQFSSVLPVYTQFYMYVTGALSAAILQALTQRLLIICR